MDYSYNWDHWKCRCSSISKIMTNGRGSEPLTPKQWETIKEIEGKIESGKATEKQKLELARLIQKDRDSQKVTLGDTAIAYLLEAYAWETEKMCSITKEMDVEYFDRGRRTEQESINLLKKVDKVDYLKNEYRFENDFLSGIPDVLSLHAVLDDLNDGPPSVARIKDIKSCKDYPAFLYKIHKGLDPGNRDQLAGYGDILECEDLAVVFTLPTMPASIREGYKMKLAYKMNAAIDQDKEFEAAWVNLERSMIFDHMPASKRVFKVPVQPFTPEEKNSVYERVKHAREWLFNFNEQYLKLNS